jgi:hypothetical protein
MLFPPHFINDVAKPSSLRRNISTANLRETAQGQADGGHGVNWYSIWG